MTEPAEGISVGIPTHNVRPVVLEEAIRSVCGQDEASLEEVVVVDDGSSVSYEAVKAAIRDPRVRWIQNETPLGMVANWNYAVRSTSCEYVMVMGHDDVLDSAMFSTYMKTFRIRPDVVLCSCARTFIDSDGRPGPAARWANDRRYIFPETSDVYVLSEEDVLGLCLRNGNPIGEPSALLFRRSVFDAVGGFDQKYDHAADVDFILRVAGRGRVAYHGKPLLRRRIHPDRLTNQNVRSGAVSRERRVLYETHGRKLRAVRQDRRIRAALVAAAVRDLLRAVAGGHWVAAKAAGGTIVRYWPVAPSYYWELARENVWGRRNQDEALVASRRLADPIVDGGE